MTMTRVLALAWCGCAAAAFGQAERVRIAPLPLKTATGDQKLDETLARKFEIKLLASKQVEMPLPDKVQEFLRTRTGAPCEKDAACLKTLAENMSSLYALAAAMRLNAAGTAYEVTAILYRVDGVKKDVAFEYKIDKNAMTPVVAGEEAIKELIARLELGKLERMLPSAPPTHPTEPAPPVVTKPAESPASPLKIGAYVAAAVAAVGGFSSLGLALSANAKAQVMMTRPGLLDDKTMGTQILESRAQAKAALGVGIGAGVAAALAVLLFIMSPSDEPAPATVTFAPIGSGGGFVFSGRLP